MNTVTELNLYANYMTEVKKRQEAIHLTLSGQKSTGFRITNAEFICLQFRKILELIALANLIANKDEYSKQYEKFANHYNASRILRDIEKVNPHFYPKPVRQIIDSKTSKVQEVVDIKENYLTKDDFIYVYNHCCDMLHADNPFGKKTDLDTIESQFKDWYNKIISLLNHHIVQLTDSKLQIWCLMHGKDDGKVHSYIFEEMGTV